MGRSFRSEKPLIYIFCEGESEQAYSKFLKEQFRDVASIKYPTDCGLFSKADALFKRNQSYKNSIEVTDEIWFFFDVEVSDHDQLENRYKIIEKLRKLRKKPNIRVRLLMTTACVEYWFMLHYQMFAPELITVPDKENMLHLVERKVPGYKKGDEATTNLIAQNYKTAVVNGEKVLRLLSGEGLPTLGDTDERNR